MYDPCDNCNKPCCYGCPHADTNEEPTAEEIRSPERTAYLIDKIKQVDEMIYWLSYQPEILNHEEEELLDTVDFLDNLRRRIEWEGKQQ